jgi:hypothetical protein
MRKLLTAGVVFLAVLAVRSQAAEPLGYLLTDTASGTW